MIRQTVKRLRRDLLDLVWRAQGEPRPEVSETFETWNERTKCSEKSTLRAAFSEVIPPVPFAGDVSTIESALGTMTTHLRAAYPADMQAPMRISFNEESVVSIPKGRVVSSLGIIVSPDNVHLQDLSGGSFPGLADHSLNFEGKQLPPVHRLAGKAVVLATGLGQRNYYHWTTEVLPRLRLLEHAGIYADHYCIPGRHRYHSESMVTLGIPKHKLVTLGKYSHVQADTLVVPSVNRQEITAENAQYLFDKLATCVRSENRLKQPTKIYVARRRRHWRCVLNESELLATLRPMGFQRYYLEDLSMLEQVALFQAADFVIGPHGSGLVNLVYCREGTRVIEIGTPVRPSGLFWTIAYHRKLKYTNFLGTAISIRGDESQIDCNIEKLTGLVKKWM